MYPRVLLLHVNQSTTGVRRSALFPCCRCPLPVDGMAQQPCAGAYFKSWSISIPRARCLVSISGVSSTACVTFQPFVGQMQADASGPLCVDRCAMKTAEKPYWNESTRTWEALFEPILASRGAYHVAVYADGVLVCTSKPMCVIATAPKTLIALNAPLTTPFERVVASLRQKYVHYRIASDARGNVWPAVTFQTADAARISYYTQLVYTNTNRLSAIRWVPCIGLVDSVAQPTTQLLTAPTAELSCLPPPPPLPLAFSATYCTARIRIDKSKKHKALESQVREAVTPPKQATASVISPPSQRVTLPLLRDSAAVRTVHPKRAKPAILTPPPVVMPMSIFTKHGTPHDAVATSIATPNHTANNAGWQPCTGRGLKRARHPSGVPFSIGDSRPCTPDADVFLTLFQDNFVCDDDVRGVPAKSTKTVDVVTMASACTIVQPFAATQAIDDVCRGEKVEGAYPLPPNADAIDIDSFFAMFGLAA